MGNELQFTPQPRHTPTILIVQNAENKKIVIHQKKIQRRILCITISFSAFVCVQCHSMSKFS